MHYGDYVRVIRGPVRGAVGVLGGLVKSDVWETELVRAVYLPGDRPSEEVRIRVPESWLEIATKEDYNNRITELQKKLEV